MNRKIGVLIPAVRSVLESNLLQGIHVQAKRMGYDVLVFTNSSNSLKEYPWTDYVKGEENIYRLAEAADLDGLIFAAGRFRNEDLIDRIMRRVEKLSVPCLILEHTHKHLPFLYPPQHESIRLITKHLIEEHGCRKLHCLTGYEGHTVAEECLQAFLETLHAYGIPTSEESYTYGDFWQERAKQLAVRIAEGSIPFPEAVVCANDAMAISLCDALKEHGIRVPEDILVTGKDGDMSASMHDPLISTVGGMDEYLGALSVKKLHEIRCKTEDHTEITASIRLQLGTSCGCSQEKADAAHQQSRDDYMQRDYLYNCTYSEYYMISNFIGQFSDARSLDAFSAIADSLAHLLPQWKRLDLCLCEDWLGDFSKPEQFRTEGYPSKMKLLLSKYRDKTARSGYTFSTKKLLPALENPHEPQFIVFTPLHVQEQVFGYSAICYDDAKAYLMEERYHNWCDAASNGLLSLKNHLYIDYMQKQIEQYSVRDPITGMYNRKGLLQLLPGRMESAAERQKAVLIMLVSWKQSTAGKNEADESIVIGNILQMSCHSEELCARVNERIFVIVQEVPTEAKAEVWMDKKLLRLIQLLKSIQGRASLQMPELVADARFVTDVGGTESVLDDAVRKLEEKLQNGGAVKNDYIAGLNQMRMEMRMMPHFEWSAETAASELGISKSYFQRLYKQQFGVTFTDDLIAVRLDKAKELLKTTNLRIQEIAEQCGYENASHFMRQFKDKIGMTAVQFRKQV